MLGALRRLPSALSRYWGAPSEDFQDNNCPFQSPGSSLQHPRPPAPWTSPPMSAVAPTDGLTGPTHKPWLGWGISSSVEVKHPQELPLPLASLVHYPLNLLYFLCDNVQEGEVKTLMKITIPRGFCQTLACHLWFSMKSFLFKAKLKFKI